MATQPQNWEKVKSLFHEALELDSSARSAFLRDKCPDAEARAEVERLLAEHDQARGFLSTPALDDFRFETEAPTPTQRVHIARTSPSSNRRRCRDCSKARDVSDGRTGIHPDRRRPTRDCQVRCSSSGSPTSPFRHSVNDGHSERVAGTGIRSAGPSSGFESTLISSKSA